MGTVGSPGPRRGFRELLGAASLWHLLPIGIRAGGVDDLDSRVHFSGTRELLNYEPGHGFRSVGVLVLLSFFPSSSPRVLSRCSLALVGHLSPQPFLHSLLLYIHESSDMSRTRRSFRPPSGPSLRVHVPCPRSLSLGVPLGFPGRLLPSGLAAQFCFLTDTCFVS